MENLVIIGAGQAAGQAIVTLRQTGFAAQITLVGDEPLVPYQRPPLSKKFLAGELDRERLLIRPEKFYAGHNVELKLGHRITKIDRDHQQAVLDDGTALPYTKLLLATGSRVRKLSIPGSELAGIHYLRSIADVEAIQQHFEAGKKLVIVGAGYIGLEVAAVAVQRGIDVTVLETEQRVMNRVVAPEISAFYQARHEQAGVKLKFGRMVESFAGDDTVKEVMCADGSRFAADFCIVGIGIIPNEELAAAAGIDCNNGIVVDEFCQTSDPAVLAAGDCTRHPNALIGMQLRLESVHNAIEQGKTAAATIVGKPVAYNEIPWFWSDQYDIKLQIVGLNAGYDKVILRGDPATSEFAGFYYQGDKLLAVDAINSPREFMLAKKLIRAGARLAPTDVADTNQDFKALANAALAATGG